MASLIRRATGHQSGVTDEAPALPRHPARLGQEVSSPHHHLRRDAPPVGALTTDQFGLDADHVQAGFSQLLRYFLSTRTEADDDRIDLHRF